MTAIHGELVASMVRWPGEPTVQLVAGDASGSIVRDPSVTADEGVRWVTVGLSFWTGSSSGFSAFGGRLPTAAAGVEVVTGWGVSNATVGAVAWVAIVPDFKGGRQGFRPPLIVFRDAAGGIVRFPPNPSGRPEPFIELTVSCPACRTTAWELRTDDSAILDGLVRRYVFCTGCGSEWAPNTMNRVREETPEQVARRRGGLAGFVAAQIARWEGRSGPEWRAGPAPPLLNVIYTPTRPLHEEPVMPEPYVRTAPLTFADVTRIVREESLGEYLDAILAALRPAFRFERVRGAAPIGGCKLGGDPDLPAGTPWPTSRRGARMAFVAQVDLAALPDPPSEWPAVGPRLSGDGHLHLFANVLEECGEPCAAHTIFAPAGTQLVRTGAPAIPIPLPDDSPYCDEEIIEGQGRQPEVRVQAVAILTLPIALPGVCHGAQDFSELACRYRALDDRIRRNDVIDDGAEWMDRGVAHLMGHPTAYQADPREIGAFVNQGWNFDIDPTPDLDDPKAWALLLDTGSMFDVMDSGGYVILIPAADLKSGRFDRVICEQHSD